MTKRTKRIGLTSIVIILLIFTACSNKKNQLNVVGNKIDYSEYKFEQTMIYDSAASIKFGVNPMIEATYMAVEMLKEETGFTNYRINRGYVGAGQERFKDYRNHKFMKELLVMVKGGYTYDAIPGTLHYFDDNFELRNDVEVEEINISRAGDMEKLQTFISHCKDFREDADFDSFFKEHEEFYMERMKKGQDRVKNNNVEEVLNEFYGVPIDEAIVTITPLSMNAYGCSVMRKDGVLEVRPTLDVFDNEKTFISILIHEISHAYVNPLTSENIVRVSKTGDLFEPISELMKKQAYSEWEIAVNEHIVRANTALMMRKIFGESEYESELESNRRLGFKYIDDVVKSIEYYTENRDKYPTLENYYVEIIKLLEDLNSDS